MQLGFTFPTGRTQGENRPKMRRINNKMHHPVSSQSGANRYYKRVGRTRDKEVETTSLSEYIKRRSLLKQRAKARWSAHCASRIVYTSPAALPHTLFECVNLKIIEYDFQVR